MNIKEPLSIKLRRWFGLISGPAAKIYKFAQPIIAGVLAEYRRDMSADEIRALVIKEIKEQVGIEIPAVPPIAVSFAIDFIFNTVRGLLRQSGK